MASCFVQCSTYISKDKKITYKYSYNITRIQHPPGLGIVILHIYPGRDRGYLTLSPPGLLIWVTIYLLVTLPCLVNVKLIKSD